MKLKLFLIIACATVLSSCATLTGGSEEKPTITQLPEQDKLTLALNTIKDGRNKSWDSDDQATHYSLDTSNTRVNYQGVPCRDFTLVTSKSFYRGQTFVGTACRYDGKWSDLQQNNLAYNSTDGNND